jgi:hypothetical protein
MQQEHSMEVERRSHDYNEKMEADGQRYKEVFDQMHEEA